MKVVVLYGGTSAERDISVVSGLAMARALADAGHDTTMVDPAVGPAPLTPDEVGEFAGIGSRPPDLLAESGAALAAVSGAAVREADVVLIALHGGTGEDGTIQGLLELAGKRYTGSGVLASAAAMDKRVSKILFERAGVPTPKWALVSVPGLGAARVGSPSFATDASTETASTMIEALGGYPVVVKPNDQGSTVGLSVVQSEDGLPGALRAAGRYSTDVLVEAYVPGREVTVSVLGDDALPVVEIVPKSGLYDYESKYTKGMSRYECPADLTEGVAGALKKSALAAFRALGCRGYARVDFRLSPANEFFCLEVNTLPGMTEVSLVPMAAEAAGIPFPALLEEMLRVALE